MVANSTSNIRPETIELIERMAGHSPRAGEPADLASIDPLALGDLWAVAHGTETWRGDGPAPNPAAYIAGAVLDLGDKMDPVFRASACRDYLDLLTRKAEGDQDEPVDRTSDYPWRKACFALRRFLAAWGAALCRESLFWSYCWKDEEAAISRAG
ncbi:hypothetical protein [Methylocystis heyeri]|uniref:Uncharacterized protein n=1 Tax=Methylocystis heyeri TaxID=391905 RepID=A0A6B8KFD6_9HYPH|nr:hypothetical protein [Methylocystis heyeri]QGM45120.1 hypothetical protein H2LOC_005125 [Methylocystis heyeri]